jgi:hypothetical protein
MNMRVSAVGPTAGGGLRQITAALAISCVEHLRLVQTAWRDAKAMRHAAMRRYPYLDW